MGECLHMTLVPISINLPLSNMFITEEVLCLA